MDATFLSPLGGLVALAVLVPTLAFAWLERRAGEVRTALALAPPPGRARVVHLGAVCAVGALLGLAAMQPVVDRLRTRHVRADAEAFFVFDTSRSMLARPAPGELTRFNRARIAGKRLRAEFRDVPVGVASLTDQVLPHAFPTPNGDVFATTVDRALGVERPPPAGYDTHATNLESLTAVATRNFFSRSATRRLIYVFSDMESRPFDADSVGTLFRRGHGIKPILVRFWGRNERVFTKQGTPEPEYRADPASAAHARRLAAASGGHAFEEDRLDAALAAGREYLGRGKTVARDERRGRIALAPYLAAAALAPLAFLLWRRNL